MSTLRWIGAVTIVGLGVLACRGESKNGQRDTLAVQPGQPSLPAPLETTPLWDSSAGPFMAVSIDYPADTVSIVGGLDSVETVTTPNPGSVSLDLFGTTGLIGTTRLGRYAGRPGRVGCEGDIWPAMRVSKNVAGWQVGFESGRALGVPLDSVDGMTGTDSAAFVSTVVRLASNSAATRDSVSARVPFVVRRAYQFQVDGAEIIAALVERNIPLESYQRSDFTMLIAERKKGSSEPYRIGFIKRTKGGESETVATSVLAAVQLRSVSRAILVVRYEQEEGHTVGFIERVQPGVWRATWESEYEGC